MVVEVGDLREALRAMPPPADGGVPRDLRYGLLFFCRREPELRIEAAWVLGLVGVAGSACGRKEVPGPSSSEG